MSIRRFCRTCKTYKSEGEFYASLRSVCKACVRLRVAAHRAANIERIRAYDRGRGFRGAPTLSADYKAKYPQRRNAQVALNNALRDGRVVPWPVCAVPTCQCAPEAHHPDYGAQLDVVWLCPPHHKQAHALARGALKAAA